MAGRITGAYVDANLFGAGKNGFRSGDPVAVPPIIPTRITRAWLNGLQEEVIRSIELLGATPDPDDLAQLGTILAAMKAKADGAIQGPVASVDNEIPRFHLATGKVAQQSGITITDAVELAYAAPKARTVVIGADELTIRNGGWTFDPSNVYLESVNNFGMVTLPLTFLPNGAQITAIQVLVDPGAVRTGTDRMRVDVPIRYNLDFTPGSPSVGITSLVFGPFFDNATSALQVVGFSGASASYSKSGQFLWLQVTAGHDAATNKDRIYGVRVDFNDPGASFR